MTTVKKQNELKNKIIKGLDIAYTQLLEFKRLKKTNLVIMKDNKIVKLKVL